MKIIGIEEVDFLPKNADRPVSGKRLYLTEAIPAKKGVGLSVEIAFFNQQKLDNLSFKPALGQEVELSYNKYGNAKSAKLLEDVEIS